MTKKTDAELAELHARLNHAAELTIRAGFLPADICDAFLIVARNVAAGGLSPSEAAKFLENKIRVLADELRERDAGVWLN
jgi:hypothetical protein